MQLKSYVIILYTLKLSMDLQFAETTNFITLQIHNE